MKVTLITGASGGIGEAFARQLAKEGHHLLLVARSADKLKTLSEQLSQQYKITAHYLAVDLAKSGSDQIIADEVVHRNLQVDWLINNAGIGTGGDLMIHPDLLQGTELAKKIRQYDFFHYEVNEALILSADEEQDIEELFRKIQQEINRPIDKFSQDVLIAQLDLLFTYSNRFYDRQFITRRPLNNNLLSSFEILLDEFFSQKNINTGLPTIGYFADKLHMSAKYFSDMLKQLTGLTAQQHIHEKLIEKAKKKLSTSELSVSEIAYELGFEHSQSFSKFFKSKTQQSPMEFRQSMI
ncbi:MAG: helix-turn-helix protein [Bacteroidetes bacterium]|nr:helix-turn-helix protein [Bacteroidota bacterium]